MIRKNHFTCYICAEEKNFARNDHITFYVVVTTLGDIDICEQCLPLIDDWEIVEVKETELDW